MSPGRSKKKKKSWNGKPRCSRLTVFLSVCKVLHIQIFYSDKTKHAPGLSIGNKMRQSCSSTHAQFCGKLLHVTQKQLSLEETCLPKCGPS